MFALHTPTVLEFLRVRRDNSQRPRRPLCLSPFDLLSLDAASPFTLFKPPFVQHSFTRVCLADAHTAVLNRVSCIIPFINHHLLSVDLERPHPQWNVAQNSHRNPSRNGRFDKIRRPQWLTNLHSHPGSAPSGGHQSGFELSKPSTHATVFCAQRRRPRFPSQPFHSFPGASHWLSAPISSCIHLFVYTPRSMSSFTLKMST